MIDQSSSQTTAPDSFVLHLVPSAFCPWSIKFELLDISVEPVGLRLTQRDFVVRRPYANKHIHVACRRTGRVAVEGLFIQMVTPVEPITYTARWAVDGEHVARHVVEYGLIDQDFDTASEEMTLWSACGESLGGWKSRWPESWRDDRITPVFNRARMEFFRRDMGQGQMLGGAKRHDTFDDRGFILERRQTFPMPTIERERLSSPLAGPRMPSLDHAFRWGECI